MDIAKLFGNFGNLPGIDRRLEGAQDDQSPRQVQIPQMSLAAAASSTSVLDGLEELSMVYAEETQKESREEELDVRRHKSPRAMPWDTVAPAMESLFGEAENGKSPFVKSIEDTLRQPPKNVSAGKLAQQSFTDITKQFLYLKGLFEAASSSNPVLSNEAFEASSLIESEDESMARVRAGLNTYEAARAFNKNPAEADKFRDVYRRVALDSTSLREMLRNIIVPFGDGFEDVLPTLHAAITQDMKATKPSDAIKLAARLKDFYMLSAMATVFGRCRVLSRRLKTRSRNSRLGTVRLISALVDMADVPQQPSEQQCRQLSRELGSNEPQGQIALFSGMLDAARDLPLELWHMMPAREDCLGLLQRHLDAWIDKEGSRRPHGQPFLS